MIADLEDKVISSQRKREEHSTEGTACTMAQSLGHGDPREPKHEVWLELREGADWQAPS